MYSTSFFLKIEDLPKGHHTNAMMILKLEIPMINNHYMMKNGMSPSILLARKDLKQVTTQNTATNILEYDRQGGRF